MIEFNEAENDEAENKVEQLFTNTPQIENANGKSEPNWILWGGMISFLFLIMVIGISAYLILKPEESSISSNTMKLNIGGSTSLDKISKSMPPEEAVLPSRNTVVKKVVENGDILNIPSFKNISDVQNNSTTLSENINALRLEVQNLREMRREINIAAQDIKSHVNRLETAVDTFGQIISGTAKNYTAIKAPSGENKPQSELSQSEKKGISSNPTLSNITTKKGDTVYSLSHRYDMPPEDLIRINGLKEPYFLKAGSIMQVYPAKTAISRTKNPQTHVIERETLIVKALSGHTAWIGREEISNDIRPVNVGDLIAGYGEIRTIKRLETGVYEVMGTAGRMQSK